MILFQDDDTVVTEKDFENFAMSPGGSKNTPFCLGNWVVAFHHDDVLFTGILRVKANIDVSKRVNGICRYYNKKTKIQNIKNVVLQY